MRIATDHGQIAIGVFDVCFDPSPRHTGRGDAIDRLMLKCIARHRAPFRFGIFLAHTKYHFPNPLDGPNGLLGIFCPLMILRGRPGLRVVGLLWPSCTACA